MWTIRRKICRKTLTFKATRRVTSYCVLLFSNLADSNPLERSRQANVNTEQVSDGICMDLFNQQTC
jgi:hypothetical protein